jgi:hypothetical protein
MSAAMGASAARLGGRQRAAGPAGAEAGGTSMEQWLAGSAAAAGKDTCCRILPGCDGVHACMRLPSSAIACGQQPVQPVRKVPHISCCSRCCRRLHPYIQPIGHLAQPLSVYAGFACRWRFDCITRRFAQQGLSHQEGCGSGAERAAGPCFRLAVCAVGCCDSTVVLKQVNRTRAQG